MYTLPNNRDPLRDRVDSKLETCTYTRRRPRDFRTAIPFWGHTTYNLTVFSPNWDSGTKWVVYPFRTALFALGTSYVEVDPGVCFASM